jgi:hypothetical protein
MKYLEDVETSLCLYLALLKQSGLSIWVDMEAFVCCPDVMDVRNTLSYLETHSSTYQRKILLF